MKREDRIRQWWVAGVILLAVAVDQAVKLWVHGHFRIGEAWEVTSWFWLCHVENNGMAFGIEWLSKPLLTLFRIAAVVVLGWYMHRLITGEKPVRAGYLAAVAMVTAGALGNIVDCMCYGVLWDYAPVLYGKVVDMLYFPLIHNAEGDVLFFRPVFNIADSYITGAVAAIILFYRKDLDESMGESRIKN